MGSHRGQQPERKEEPTDISGSTLSMQYVSTENVSPYGARVRTNRPWKKGTSVLVKSALGELCARARIVYCQPLPANAFALGLQFLFGLAHGSRQRDAEYSD